jgi:hypothetical protein
VVARARCVACMFGVVLALVEVVMAEACAFGTRV